MKFSKAVFAAAFCCVFMPHAVVARPISGAICEAASRSFAASHLQPGPEGLFASGGLRSRDRWVSLSSADTPVEGGSHNVYLAYFSSGPYVLLPDDQYNEAVGAVSIKISVYKNPEMQSATSVELYRPSIPSGINRCEKIGVTDTFDRQISLREYSRYHQRSGDSTSLRHFHFSYPSGGSCARTDEPTSVAQTFQFPQVKVTSQTLVAQLFGVNPAFGADDARLRSELHFYRRIDDRPACVGFFVRLDQPRASVVIHDLSSGGFSARGPWLIHLQ